MGWPFVLTLDEFFNWLKITPQKCTYCDLVDPRLNLKFGKQLSMFTIDRMDNNRPYAIENICFACFECNRLKADYFSFDEFRKVAQEMIRPKWAAKIAALDSMNLGNMAGGTGGHHQDYDKEGFTSVLPLPEPIL